MDPDVTDTLLLTPFRGQELFANHQAVRLASMTHGNPHCSPEEEASEAIDRMQAYDPRGRLARLLGTVIHSLPPPPTKSNFSRLTAGYETMARSVILGAQAPTSAPSSPEVDELKEYIESSGNQVSLRSLHTIQEVADARRQLHRDLWERERNSVLLQSVLPGLVGIVGWQIGRSVSQFIEEQHLQEFVHHSISTEMASNDHNFLRRRLDVVSHYYSTQGPRVAGDELLADTEDLSLDSRLARNIFSTFCIGQSVSSFALFITRVADLRRQERLEIQRELSGLDDLMREPS